MEQHSSISLFLALGIVIGSARVAGGIARRFHQPRVLGELLVGVLLGPTLLDVLHSTSLGLDQAHLETTIHEFSQLGVLLLMFKIGLDVHLRELLGVGKVAVLAGIGGAVLPVLLTLPVMLLLGYPLASSLFTGVALAATSVSISAQVLLELNILQTKEGNGLLASALIDDVVAIILVSFTFVLIRPQEGADAASVLGIFLRMGFYLLVAFSVAWFLLPRLLHWLHLRPSLAHSYGVPTAALILALLFGWSAEAWGGVAAITGAFIAGVGLSRSEAAVKRPIDVAISNIAYTFLVPIFFVSVGLEINLREFPLNALPFAGVLLFVAIASKIVGCGVGAYWGGFSREEAFRLGVCMVSRGEVGLIIASLGLATQVFEAKSPLFGALFLVILLTTVITPPMVRRVFQHEISPSEKKAVHGTS